MKLVIREDDGVTKAFLDGDLLVKDLPLDDVMILIIILYGKEEGATEVVLMDPEGVIREEVHHRLGPAAVNHLTPDPQDDEVTLPIDLAIEILSEWLLKLRERMPGW